MSWTTYRGGYTVEQLESRCLLSGTANGAGLDPAFGNGGSVTPNEPQDLSVTNALVNDSGQTILAGTRRIKLGKNDVSQMFLTEFNRDGSLNSTFGTGGVAAIRSGSVQMQEALLESDGKIVIIGNTGSGQVDTIFVVRFNADGLLDHSFNLNGQLLFQFGGNSSLPVDAAIGPDNKLVIVAHTTDSKTQQSRFGLARLNEDGSFDNTFGVNGQITYHEAGGANYHIAIRPNGKIVLGGSDGNFVFTQLNVDGSIDTTFAQNGFGAYGLGHGGEVNTISSQDSVALLDNGDLIFAATAVPSPKHDRTEGIVLRVTPKGKIDKTFGTGGQFSILDTGFNFVTASKRRLYIANEGQVYRLTLDGKLDQGFGSAGSASATNPAATSDPEVESLSLADGTINLAIEFKDTPIGQGFLHAVEAIRLTPSGTPDTSFGEGGGVSDQSAGANGLFADVTTNQAGKIIAVGIDLNAVTGEQALIEQFDSNGQPDSTFGKNGIVSVDVTDENDRAQSVVVDPNTGRIYVGVDSGGEPAILRLLPNGSLDPSWGAGGKLIVNSIEGISNLLLQPDGKVIAAGVANAADGDTDFCMARFNADGSADTSFDADGRVATDLGPGTGDNYLARALLAPDGKILLAGTRNATPDFQDEDLALIRYNADGSRDKSFGSKGKVFTNLSEYIDQDDGDYEEVRSNDSILDAVILPDGQTMVSAEQDGQVELVQYDAVGKLVNNFQSNALAGDRIALSSDGKLVVLDTSDGTVGRDTAQFAPDASFGTNGEISLGGIGSALAIDSDGRILVAGSSGSAPLIERILA